MKYIFVLVLITVILQVNAQENVKSSFRKYSVESTGCSLYLPQPAGEWDIQKSPDGATVLTNSVASEGFAFDVIAVQFVEPFLSNTSDDMEALLISYLDYLKTQLQVTESVGYGKGHKLPANEDAIGVVDFWRFEDGTQGKIKGWVNSAFLFVLMVSGTDDPSAISATDVFLNGLVLPGK